MTYQYKREPLRSNEEFSLRGAVRTPREVLCVTLLLESGIRVSELAELRREQIDWQARRLVIMGKGGRNGHNSKRRILPLSPEAVAVLESTNMLLFRDPAKKTWISTRTIHRLIRRLANQAGVTRKTSPHVLRHTFAVNCLKRGIGLPFLMKLLGHENLKTTQCYENLAPEDVCEEFDKKWPK